MLFHLVWMGVLVLQKFAALGVFNPISILERSYSVLGG